MAFAGDTMWAYPIIGQTQNQIAAYRPSLSRENDLLEAKGHALRVINAMIREGDALRGPDAPDSTADFLFGGYSAKEQAFRIWRFAFSPGKSEYVAERIKPGHFGQCCFIGDVSEEANELLKTRLRAREPRPRRHLLDVEPLEIIRDFLRQGSRSTIGGPVQLLKVYRHMNTKPFVVLWRSTADGPVTRTLLGRTLLDYEALDAPIVDVDSPFGPPPPGPGARLEQWDADLLSIVVEDGGVDADTLVAAAHAKDLEIDDGEVRDWLSYAEHRGLVTGEELKWAVVEKLPWTTG